MTMTLAGRCDNQAIGGVRHIRWETRGSIMALTLLCLPSYSQLNNTALAKERSGW
jgi:hypothetical protein